MPIITSSTSKRTTSNKNTRMSFSSQILTHNQRTDMTTSSTPRRKTPVMREAMKITRRCTTNPIKVYKVLFDDDSDGGYSDGSYR